MPNSLKGSQPDPLEPDDFRTYIHLNDYNDLRGREGWRPDPLAPPLTLAETDDGPSWAPFSFVSKGLSSCDRPLDTAKLTKIGL